MPTPSVSRGSLMQQSSISLRRGAASALVSAAADCGLPKASRPHRRMRTPAKADMRFLFRDLWGKTEDTADRRRSARDKRLEARVGIEGHV